MPEEDDSIDQFRNQMNSMLAARHVPDEVIEEAKKIVVAAMHVAFEDGYNARDEQG